MNNYSRKLHSFKGGLFAAGSLNTGIKECFSLKDLSNEHSTVDKISILTYQIRSRGVLGVKYINLEHGTWKKKEKKKEIELLFVDARKHLETSRSLGDKTSIYRAIRARVFLYFPTMGVQRGFNGREIMTHGFRRCGETTELSARQGSKRASVEISGDSLKFVGNENCH